MFADGRLFLGCAALLFSVSITPKSTFSPRAEEGGANNGSFVREQNGLDEGGYKDSGTNLIDDTAPE